MPQLSRSVINASIATAREAARCLGCALPSFAFWGVEEWRHAGPEAEEIRDCMLGWDVTDFGSRDFANIGRVLFTLRNGRHDDARYPKPYAEKLLIDPENQRAPAHFHRSKREDIIALAGGNILVELEPADADGRRSGRPMRVSVDGLVRRIGPREIIRLSPGMSLTIPPLTIHQFWAEEGTGLRLEDGKRYSLSREISSVCDDLHDNVFLDTGAVRFPEVLEDTEAQSVLCHEYRAIQQRRG